ncbi:MAG: 30S ribosomal protein S21 [Candidatus Saccharimonadales bacterium]
MADMITVTKKDSGESVENLLRRFNRKVQQAGVLTNAKMVQFFEKPPTKRDRRLRAIVRRERRAAKIKKLKLGR